jgi:ABC-type transport system involved in cytochrome c biogenesis ATPase subunit
MTSDAPILSLAHVDTYYGDSHVLHDLTFTVGQGEIVGLLGRNGVGKTTTIQTILGLPSPRRGSISFQGRPISGRPTFAIVRGGIGWVPQGHRIFPTLSLDENLELAATRSRAGRWTVAEMYRLFPRLETRRNARGDALSGGEQQMLAIARARAKSGSDPDGRAVGGFEPAAGRRGRGHHPALAAIGRFHPAGRTEPRPRVVGGGPHSHHEQGIDRILGGVRELEQGADVVRRYLGVGVG